MKHLNIKCVRRNHTYISKSYGFTNYLEQMLVYSMLYYNAIEQFKYYDKVFLCEAPDNDRYVGYPYATVKEIKELTLDYVKERLAFLNVMDYITPTFNGVARIYAYPCNYEENPNKPEEVKESEANTEWDNCGWWYLDGEVEHLNGYDKGTIINSNKLGLSRDTIRWGCISGNECTEYDDIPFKQMYFKGIIRCNVLDIAPNCIGFFYPIREQNVKYDKGTFPYWEIRGQVNRIDDTESLVFSYYKYLTKTFG